MKALESLSIDYWIDNTKIIYEDRESGMHISHPVIEAFEAGFKAARAMAIKKVQQTTTEELNCDNLVNLLEELGEYCD